MDLSTVLDINFAGRDFRLTSAGGADIVAREMARGVYEAPLPVLTMAVLARSDGLFLDVGANTGLYSVLAAKVRPETQVIAFEPFPAVLPVLRENLRLNGLEPQVTLVEVALSDEAGSAPLFVPDQSHGLMETSCSLQQDFQNTAGSVSVKKQRLDDIELPGPVALIKADIEGHEAAFLRGARKVLEQDRPIVFAEFLPVASRNFHPVSRLLAELDYLPFRLRSEAAILSRQIIHDPLAWNYGLVPVEKLDLFRQCCTVHGIAVTQPF